MPFYMFKGRYTTDALKAMVANPQDREVAARKLVEGLGGKLHHLFFCFGEDDIIALVEAPDDETMAAAALVIGASGAMSGGATVKLMTASEAMTAMQKAGSTQTGYKAATATGQERGAWRPLSGTAGGRRWRRRLARSGSRSRAALCRRWAGAPRRPPRPARSTRC